MEKYRVILLLSVKVLQKKLQLVQMFTMKGVLPSIYYLSIE